jgi:hypothetical protein
MVVENVSLPILSFLSLAAVFENNEISSGNLSHHT